MPMRMDEVFGTLRQYQEILSRRVELEKQLEAMPKTIEIQNQMLSREKKSLSEVKEQYEKSEASLKELRQALAEAEMKRENAEKQMDGITTQREYDSVNKEIREASEKEQELRRRIQEEERRFADIDDRLHRIEMSVSTLEAEIAQKRAEIDEHSKEISDEIETLWSKENDLTHELDEDLKFKFERIIRSKSGMGIVPIHGVVCTGCHMMLPANFVNEVRQADKIVFCPYCSRILYYEETETDESMEEILAGSLVDLNNDEIEEGEDSESNDDTDETSGKAKRGSARKKRVQSEPLIDNDFLIDTMDE
ncbi:MAG TPA: nucleic acid-binding protein [Spirochaetaceae bacterium]|nr:nucleic acid-binding protein [Spirochaetaceae bacterium]